MTRIRLGPRTWLAGPAAAAVVVAACEHAPTAVDEPAPLPNPVSGQTVFLAQCATCHSSRDGFDLAFFAFPDSTIVRRAVAHVDTSEALDIAAYIHTLGVASQTRTFRPFQPDGRRVSSDVEFAVALFGQDEWPSSLTTEGLRAVNPLQVTVSLAFPLWSSEPDNLDWMPESPPPEGILAYHNEAISQALAAYYETRGLDALLRTVQLLRLADRDTAEPAAPCVMRPPERLRPVDCFELRRWTASLVAQHMLRSEVIGSLHPLLHDTWWDVGDAARHALLRDGFFEHGLENWAVWMYLGWAFAPDRHASVYLGGALMRLGLPRHATLVALRSEVVRPPRSVAAYHDVRSAARFAPPSWTFAATRFGFSHLLERLRAGSAPRDEQRQQARESVEAAWVAAARNVTAAEGQILAALRDEVLALLH